MVIATTLTLVNVALIGTKYNSIGICFGFIGVYYWIKAVKVKK